MIDLTKIQAMIVRQIHGFLLVHGYPPTLREICKMRGYSSTNAVTDHLDCLEKKGYVVVDRMVGRGIRLLRSVDGEEIVYRAPVLR